MDSLSNSLTSFDDISINCQVHDIPAIGVCGDNLCKERKFFCMKCVSSNDTCITILKHELVSLSELFYRFFIKQETKAIDLVEINSMMEALKEIDRMEITKNLSDFTRTCQNHVTKCFDNFYAALKQKFDETKKNNLLNIEKLITTNNNVKGENENLKLLNDLYLTDCLTNFNPQTVKDFLKSNVSREEKEKCISTIKFLSNFDRVSKTITAAEDVIALNKMTIPENYINFEQKIDEKIKQIETKIFQKIDNLEKILIPPKDNIVIIKNVTTKFSGDPNNLVFKKDICESAHKSNSIDSVFCSFKSVNGDFFIVWGTPSYAIEVYDMKIDKIVKTITGAHTSTIFACRHYLEKKGKKDLVITSSYDKSVKVWSVKDGWNNIVNIPGAHTGYYIYSVCILSDEYENKNYIISAAPNEYSKVWDFNAKFIKDFGVNNESTYYINTWYDAKSKKYYVINANSADVKSYDFKSGLLYKSYKGTPQTWHMSAIVNEVNNTYQLIESDGNGNVRIWDFHLGTQLKVIATSGINLRGICLWNDQYLFASGSDYNVKLYDLKASTFVKSFNGHTSTVCSVDKMIHPKLGECLISHALDGKLKLWVQK